MGPNRSQALEKAPLSGEEIDRQLQQIQRREITYHGEAITVRYADELIKLLKNKAPGVVADELRKRKLSHEAWHKIHVLEDDINEHLYGGEFAGMTVTSKPGIAGTLYNPTGNGKAKSDAPKPTLAERRAAMERPAYINAEEFKRMKPLGIENRKKVYEAIAAGHRTTEAIATHIEISKFAVMSHLNELLANESVYRTNSNGRTYSYWQKGETATEAPQPAPTQRPEYVGPNEKLHATSVIIRRRVFEHLALGETGVKEMAETLDVSGIIVGAHIDALIRIGKAKMSRTAGRKEFFVRTGTPEANGDAPPTNGDVPGSNGDGKPVDAAEPIAERLPYVGENEKLDARSLRTRKRLYEGLTETPQTILALSTALGVSGPTVQTHAQALVAIGIAIGARSGTRYLYSRPGVKKEGVETETPVDAPADTESNGTPDDTAPQFEQPAADDATAQIPADVVPTPWQESAATAKYEEPAPRETAMIADPENDTQRIARLELRVTELSASLALVNGEVAELRAQVEQLLTGVTPKPATPPAAKPAPAPAALAKPVDTPAVRTVVPPAPAVQPAARPALQPPTRTVVTEPAPAPKPPFTPKPGPVQILTTSATAEPAPTGALPARLFEGIDESDSHKRDTRLKVYKHLQVQNDTAWGIGLGVGRTTLAVEPHLRDMIKLGLVRITGGGMQATYALVTTGVAVAAPAPTKPQPTAAAPTPPLAQKADPIADAPADADDIDDETPAGAITVATFPDMDIDETKLTKAGKIAAFLAKKGEASIGEITTYLQCAPLTTPKYLEKLTDAGVATFRKDGQRKMYRLVVDQAGLEEFFESDRSAEPTRRGPKPGARAVRDDGDDAGTGPAPAPVRRASPTPPNPFWAPPVEREKPRKRVKSQSGDTGSTEQFVGSVENAVPTFDPAAHKQKVQTGLHTETPVEHAPAILEGLRTMKSLHGNGPGLEAFYAEFLPAHEGVTKKMLIQWYLLGESAWEQLNDLGKPAEPAEPTDEAAATVAAPERPVSKTKPRSPKHAFTIDPFTTPDIVEQQVTGGESTLDRAARESVMDVVTALDMNMTMNEWDEYAELVEYAREGKATQAHRQRFKALFQKAYPFVPRDEAEMIVAIMFTPSRSLALDAELKRMVDQHLTFN